MANDYSKSTIVSWVVGRVRSMPSKNDPIQINLPLERGDSVWDGTAGCRGRIRAIDGPIHVRITTDVLMFSWKVEIVG
jgi:hypothetical protein